MKNSKKLIGILLTVVMLVSVLSVVTVAAGAGDTLYLKPSDTWKTDGARFAAYFFDASGNNTWADAADSNGDGAYEVIIPSGDWSNVIFCRMDPGTAENDWVNKWNQTADLAIPTDNNVYYTLAEGVWDNSGSEGWGTASSGTPSPTFEGYCVAGVAGLCGAEWDATSAVNVMTLNSETGLYELELADIAAGSYEFKVTTYGWVTSYPSENYQLTVDEDSDVKILFNESTGEITVELTPVDAGNGSGNEGSGNEGSGNEGNPDSGDNSAIFVMVGMTALLGMAAMAVVAKKQRF